MKITFARVLAGLAILFCVVGLYGEGPSKVSHRIEISVIPGASWSSVMWIGPIPVKKYSQAAAWVETVSGEYVATLSVTGSAATGKWKGNPAGGRPEALPIWNTARTAKRAAGAAGAASAGAVSADVVSSATPTAGFSRNLSLDSLIPGQEYRIRFEINTSFDYNEFWTKKAKKGEAGYSGVNGQPSVLYEGIFRAGSAGTVTLRPVGYGSVDGSSGGFTPGTWGLTTALTLVESVTARIE